MCNLLTLGPVLVVMIILTVGGVAMYYAGRMIGYDQGHRDALRRNGNAKNL